MLDTENFDAAIRIIYITVAIYLMNALSMSYALTLWSAFSFAEYAFDRNYYRNIAEYCNVPLPLTVFYWPLSLLFFSPSGFKRVRVSRRKRLLTYEN